MATLIPQSSAMSAAGLAASDSASSTTLKLVAFPLGQLLLALPMQAISRVINMPEVHGSGVYPVGVTTAANQQVTVVDLHRLIFQAPAPNMGQKRGYLIIIPNQTGNPLGIPTFETPLLFEVPSHDIRALPDAYRQVDTLAIASHITRITLENGETKPVFLLDTAAVMTQLMARSVPPDQAQK